MTVLTSTPSPAVAPVLSPQSPPGKESAPVLLQVAGTHRLLACGLAMLPFLTAVIAHRWPVHASAVQVPLARTPLVFEQYLVNLGPVPAVREVGARYTFKNVGAKPIRITDLEPSCGCLNPRLDKRDYAPNELGAFFLKVQTAGQSSGVNEYTVRVKYDERDDSHSVPVWVTQEPIELSFKMLVPEKQVSVAPRALAFYQLSRETTSQDVVVTDERGTDLEIWDVTASTSLVTVERLGQSTEHGVVRHTLRITVAGDVPPGRSRALVTIKTSDPNYRVLQVPLLIQGPDSSSSAATAWKVEPQQLHFPTNAGLLTPPQEVVITGVIGQPVEVTRIAGDASAIRSRILASDTDADGRPRVRVQLQLTGIPGGHTFRDVVSLRTNDRKSPLLQIPVTIGPAVQQAGGARPATKPGPTLE